MNTFKFIRWDAAQALCALIFHVFKCMRMRLKLKVSLMHNYPVSYSIIEFRGVLIVGYLIFVGALVFECTGGLCSHIMVWLIVIIPNIQ